MNSLRLHSLHQRFALAIGLALGIGTTHAALAAPGELDLRFGLDGVAFVGNGGAGERILALLPESDGGVLAGGELQETPSAPMPTPGSGMTVLRLDANGDLDASWGLNGFIQIGLGGDQEYASALLRQSDGRVLVAGTLEPGANTDFGVARLHPDGRLDDSFGAPDGGGARRGHVNFNMGPTSASNDAAQAIALQSDGRILVAGIGTAVDGSFTYPRFAIARLSASGELDASFGDGGRIIAAPVEAQTSEYVTAIALRRDGRLDPDDGFIVAGYVFARGTAVLRRYTANGTPDATFGQNGVVVLRDQIVGGVRTGLGRIDAAAIQNDGRIVLLGRGGDRGFAFLRLNPDGSLDPSFGTQGRTLVKFSGSVDYDEPAALVLQANGRIVAAGRSTSRSGNGGHADFASARLLSDGRPDPTYGDGAGRSEVALTLESDEAFAVTVTSDGSLLFAGRADVVAGSGGDDEGAFLRLLGDPDLFSDGFED